jgi:serine protease DegQ
MRPSIAALSLALCASCVPAPPKQETAPPTSYVPSTLVAPLDDTARGVVRIRNTECDAVGVGSGFFVDAATLVTNRHVANGAKQLEVERWNGEPLTATSPSIDPEVDLATIKVAGANASMHLAARDASPGDRVRAVGYPEAGKITATAGRVIEFFDGATIDPELAGRLMRTSTPIKPGNSGGPVLDRRGEVVGVIFATDARDSTALAIPVSRLRDALSKPTVFQPVDANCDAAL